MTTTPNPRMVQDPPALSSSCPVCVDRLAAAPCQGLPPTFCHFLPDEGGREGWAPHPLPTREALSGTSGLQQGCSADGHTGPRQLLWSKSGRPEKGTHTTVTTPPPPPSRPRPLQPPRGKAGSTEAAGPKPPVLHRGCKRALRDRVAPRREVPLASRATRLGGRLRATPPCHLWASLSPPSPFPRSPGLAPGRLLSSSAATLPPARKGKASAAAGRPSRTLPATARRTPRGGAAACCAQTGSGPGAAQLPWPRPRPRGRKTWKAQRSARGLRWRKQPSARPQWESRRSRVGQGAGRPSAWQAGLETLLLPHRV